MTQTASLTARLLWRIERFPYPPRPAPPAFYSAHTSFRSALSAGAASAIPKDFTVRFYFTDASMTEAAGDYVQTCSGRRYSNGVATPYYEEVTGDCGRGGATACEAPFSAEAFLECVTFGTIPES